MNQLAFSADGVKSDIIAAGVADEMPLSHAGAGFDARFMLVLALSPRHRRRQLGRSR